MRAVLALLLLSPIAAHAESHSVTVRNTGSETIRSIQIGPAGSLGENRMRSQLPVGAEARITYSTGCKADVRLGYASGRSEDHPGVDVCTDPRIMAGQDGVAGPAIATAPAAPATPVGTAATGTRVAAKTTASSLPAKAPPPVVPPWTGKSITKRFGGMD